MFPNIVSLRTRYAGTSDTRPQPSPIIWQHYHPENFQLTGSSFLGWDGSVASNVGTYRDEAGGWVSYEDTNATILLLATEHTGVLEFSTSASDNLQAVMELGSATANQAEISRGVTTAGTDKTVLFEARVRFPSIANGKNFFIGLAEENVAADSFFVDAGGAVADKDFIGFKIKEGDGNAILAQYGKESGTQKDVGTFSTALVADTWYKFGFKYLPTAPDAEKITFYMDGGDLGSYVTLTNMAVAADFPDEQELGITMGISTSGATDEEFDCDWVYVAQEL